MEKKNVVLLGRVDSDTLTVLFPSIIIFSAYDLKLGMHIYVRKKHFVLFACEMTIRLCTGADFICVHHICSMCSSRHIRLQSSKDTILSI